MIKVKVKNQHSPYYQQLGKVAKKEWNLDLLWVEVSINGKVITMARTDLEVS
jgi:hypothetical protein